MVMKALGFEANRDLVISGKLGLFRIVHFATHTFFRAKQAELAAIILSHFDKRGQARDYLLRTQDISSLDLRADLVVLSSCSSGLGKNVPGEGIAGFPQAFLSAGALGVVMSVWDVEDRSTSVLMTLFYRNMLIRGMSPSTALKEAQVSMWKDPRHNAPWFWAGFLAQGEWKNPMVPLNKSSSGVSSERGGPKIPSMTTTSPLIAPSP
jgi:CHAT domain-containing protein